MPNNDRKGDTSKSNNMGVRERKASRPITNLSTLWQIEAQKKADEEQRKAAREERKAAKKEFINYINRVTADEYIKNLESGVRGARDTTPEQDIITREAIFTQNIKDPVVKLGKPSSNLAKRREEAKKSKTSNPDISASQSKIQKQRDQDNTSDYATNISEERHASFTRKIDPIQDSAQNKAASQIDDILDIKPDEKLPIRNIRALNKIIKERESRNDVKNTQNPPSGNDQFAALHNNIHTGNDPDDSHHPPPASQKPQDHSKGPAR